ncbi:hypothetical protein EVAR_24475_1 [Eumeta japonica]|uniref:Uncharacterized protein n=1 Tax=Eumeta variegata TaxID=151549 RepID=A0A4C1WYV4_EUMVA|nr:hypothetical protein EVAR_24475_1 [Eumeta japonica]
MRNANGKRYFAHMRTKKNTTTDNDSLAVIHDTREATSCVCTRALGRRLIHKSNITQEQSFRNQTPERSTTPHAAGVTIKRRGKKTALKSDIYLPDHGEPGNGSNVSRFDARSAY